MFLLNKKVFSFFKKYAQITAREEKNKVMSRPPLFDVLLLLLGFFFFPS